MISNTLKKVFGPLINLFKLFEAVKVSSPSPHQGKALETRLLQDSSSGYLCFNQREKTCDT